MAAIWKASIPNTTRSSNQGQVLLTTVGDDRLEDIVDKNWKILENSWTTAGLMRSMQGLFETFSRQAEKVLAFSAETRGFVENVYTQFHKQYGFKKISPPDLNLERHILRMHSLQQRTERFCKNPVNVVGREKRFVIRRFHRELVEQATQLFRDVRNDLDSWLKGALTPLAVLLQEHQRLLAHRVESLKKIDGDVNSLHERVRYLEKQRTLLGKQFGDLSKIRDTLGSEAPQDKEEDEAASAAAAA